MVSKKLYPFTGHYHDLHGLQYHYLDEGQGETVVMVHGNPTWSFYYRNLVLALRADYRVIVPDHIGCGLSDKPVDSGYSFTLQQRVDDLESLLEALGLREKITLVLHDWGGMIGMAYASRHPERIARLVILNTGAFPLPAAKKFPWALRICRDTQFGVFLVQGLNAFARMAARVGCKRHPLSKELRDAYCSPYDTWHHRIATLRFVQDIPLSPDDPGFALIQEVAVGLHRFSALPMLICWGERDFVFDHHFRDEWQRRFPAAEVHSYPDCGHYILEDAAEEVIPLIQQFLSHHPLTSPG